MKNFDESRAERRSSQGEQFQIGGETFTVNVNVNPSVLLALDKIDEDGAKITAVLSTVDGAILAMIVDADGTEEGGHARYHALRERAEDPLTVADLSELAEWLIGAQSGRPPTQPSAS